MQNTVRKRLQNKVRNRVWIAEYGAEEGFRMHNTGRDRLRNRMRKRLRNAEYDADQNAEYNAE